MIVPGIIISIIVGLLRGGNIERLGELGLRALPLVWLAFALRLSVGLLDRRGFAYAAWVLVTAYLLFFVAVGLNLSAPGMKCFGLGSFLNFLVIALNGGTMPVSPRAMMMAGITDPPTGTHSLLTAQTRLGFLGDIIPAWTPFPQVISVGDILIIIGIFMFIQHRMVFGEAAVALVSANK
jgi:hypothetical protein